MIIFLADVYPFMIYRKSFCHAKKVNKITQGITLHINNLLQGIDIALINSSDRGFQLYYKFSHYLFC